jgi:cytochrome c5
MTRTSSAAVGRASKNAAQQARAARREISRKRIVTISCGIIHANTVCLFPVFVFSWLI